MKSLNVPLSYNRESLDMVFKTLKMPPCHCNLDRLTPGTHREVCSIVQWGCDSLIVPNQHLPALQLPTECLQSSHEMQTT